MRIEGGSQLGAQRILLSLVSVAKGPPIATHVRGEWLCFPSPKSIAV